MQLRAVFFQARRYAGHNKWSKIKREKGRNDTTRGMAFGKVSSQIISAINAGNGEMDPSLNVYLASALNKAKQIQMPKSSIEQALSRAKMKNNLDNHENRVYEGVGPSGIAVMVEAFTGNRNKTFNEVRHLFKEYGSLGSVGYLFRRSTFFVINADDLEQCISDIIDAECALNFKEISANEIEVETEIKDFSKFLKAVKSHGYTVSSTDIRFEALDRIPIVDEQALEAFISEMEELDEVVRVYHNGAYQN